MMTWLISAMFLGALAVALGWLWIGYPLAAEIERGCLGRPAPAGDIPKTAYCQCLAEETSGVVHHAMRTVAPAAFVRSDDIRARNICTAKAMSGIGRQSR